MLQTHRPCPGSPPCRSRAIGCLRFDLSFVCSCTSCRLFHRWSVFSGHSTVLSFFLCAHANPRSSLVCAFPCSGSVEKKTLRLPQCLFFSLRFYFTFIPLLVPRSSYSFFQAMLHELHPFCSGAGSQANQFLDEQIMQNNRVSTLWITYD